MLDLAQYDDSNLPADMALDPNHPASDPFIQSLQSIQKRIIAQAQLMPRQHAEVVRLVHQGLSNEDIQNRTGRKVIGTVMKKDASKRLLALLQHLSVAMGGATIAQRKNLLWRIAQREEYDGPRTSIAAIAELNKFDLADQANATTRATAGGTVITINQQILPRGKLDEDIEDAQVIEQS